MQVFATKAVSTQVMLTVTFIVIGAGWGILKQLLNLCNKKTCSIVEKCVNQYFSSTAFTAWNYNNVFVHECVCESAFYCVSQCLGKSEQKTNKEGEEHLELQDMNI